MLNLRIVFAETADIQCQIPIEGIISTYDEVLHSINAINGQRYCYAQK